MTSWFAQRECKITYSAVYHTGYYGVAAMIEDFAKPTDTEALSSCRYSSWCTFSIRMKRATNVLTSRRRRVQRGLALAFHLEERISIESSCELEDHQRGDVKIWLCVVVLVVLCVDIVYLCLLDVLLKK